MRLTSFKFSVRRREDSRIKDATTLGQAQAANRNYKASPILEKLIRYPIGLIGKKRQ